jgi:type I restriction enzyme S subunit
MSGTPITIVRLGEVADAIRGVSFSGGDASDAFGPDRIACLTTRAVQESIAWSSARYIPAAYVRGDEQLVRPGDIIVSTANSAPLVGKSAIVRDVPEPTTIGAFVTLLRPGERLWPEYLAYWMRTEGFLRRVRTLASQTTSIANLRVSDLLTMELPLPSVEQQRRLASRLADQMESGRAASNAANHRAQLMRDLLRAVLGRALAARTNWRSIRLGEVTEIQLGKMLSPASRTGERPIPYLRNANVQWDHVDLDDVAEMDFDEAEEEKFRLREGDVLVCEGGEPGRAAVWHGQIDRCCYQKALHRLRPIDDSVDPQFLVYRLWMGALNGEFTREQAKTTIAHLPAIRLATLVVALPPISEQRAIASAVHGRLKAIQAIELAALAQARAIDALPTQILRAGFGQAIR